MATVTIEPVAWQWSVHGQWYTVAPREVTDPETYAKRMAIDTLGEARAIFTSEALAQARAEGKAEGMRDTPATHRHKKRGSEYVLMGYGKMQAEDWMDTSHKARMSGEGASIVGGVSVDMREVAIYRSATDPTEIWVRPREEFEDGRFEALPSAPAADGDAG